MRDVIQCVVDNTTTKSSVCMAGDYKLVHLALLTSCSPIHSAEGDSKRTPKYPTHLNADLNRAIAFTDAVCFMFKSHNNCGEKCILSAYSRLYCLATLFWLLVEKL